MSRKKKPLSTVVPIRLEIPSEDFDPENPQRADLRTEYITIENLINFLDKKGITKEMYGSVTLTIGTERFGEHSHLLIEYDKTLSPEEIKELEKREEEEEERKLKESAERKRKLAEKKKKKEAVISKLSKEEKELLGIKQ
jgi:hypothetical protein